MTTTTKPPIVKPIDWTKIVEGDGERKKHIVCNRCNPRVIAEVVTLCGKKRRGGRNVLEGQRPKAEHCEMCAVAAAEVIPCSPSCPRGRRE